MASLLLHKTGENFDHKPYSLDGLMFANSAIQFAALAFVSHKAALGHATWYLYAMAAELAFKSLALRSDAKPADCKKAGHKISRVVQLIEQQGISVPHELKFKIVDDPWFTEMLETRYPIQTNTGMFINSNYVELIAEALELQCKSLLKFEGGSAIAEIRIKAGKLGST